MTDFLQLISRPSAALDEGFRFFQGVGLLNETLAELAADLSAHRVGYAVIGGIALNAHGYKRFTTNINV